MPFKITPDDGTLAYFEIGRLPDWGNEQQHDLGQTVARSEGTKVYVLGSAVETRIHRFTFTGLSSHEFWYLRRYIEFTIAGSSETSVLTWDGNTINDVRYVPDSFQGREYTDNAWVVDVLFREEVA